MPGKFPFFSQRTVFFFNDTATTEIYTLSLHDALPIFSALPLTASEVRQCFVLHRLDAIDQRPSEDRKSTRLNSSHVRISYAVFCLKKKKIIYHMPGRAVGATLTRHVDS